MIKKSILFFAAALALSAQSVTIKPALTIGESNFATYSVNVSALPDSVLAVRYSITATAADGTTFVSAGTIPALHGKSFGQLQMPWSFVPVSWSYRIDSLGIIGTKVE